MIDSNKSVRALLLLSGGLDSQLAACLMRDQGIEIQAVVFTSPFFDGVPALEAARELEIPIEVVDFTSRMVHALETCPAFDEPSSEICIACHREMLKCAAEQMVDFNCQFIVTGEVLNQRIPTQSQQTLDDVDHYAESSGLIVRPLSAQELPETLPEKNGWVDRSRLLGLEGPGRKDQISHADRFHLRDYPEPANPCRLTDPAFAVRLKDLRAHEGLQGQRSLALLRLGRHFRLGPVTKLIVARDEGENLELQGHAELYELLLQPTKTSGPVGMVPIIATDDQLKAAASVCARYCNVPDGDSVAIRIRSSHGAREVDVMPADQKQIDLIRI